MPKFQRSLFPFQWQALILLSFPLLGLLPTFGASSPSPSPSTLPQAITPAQTEAKLVLQKAIDFQRDAKDLVLKFRAAVYNSALDKDEKYTGKLWLKGEDKFKLEIPGGIYISDGITYTEYHSQNHQAILRKAKDLEDRPLPGEILLRFLDSDPISLGKTALGGKEFFELHLDPARAMKNLDSLVVLLDKGNFSLQRITSRDMAGNEAQYTITSLKRNGGIKEKEFAFVAPKGSDIVDMRE